MGSGQDIVIARDPWVPTISGFRPCFRAAVGLGHVLVRDLLLDDGRT